MVLRSPGPFPPPRLRVDTGDASLDAEFTAKEYLFVLVGYRARRLHPIGRESAGLALA